MLVPYTPLSSDEVQSYFACTHHVSPRSRTSCSAHTPDWFVDSVQYVCYHPCCFQLARVPPSCPEHFREHDFEHHEGGVLWGAGPATYSEGHCPANAPLATAILTVRTPHINTVVCSRLQCGSVFYCITISLIFNSITTELYKEKSKSYKNYIHVINSRKAREESAWRDTRVHRNTLSWCGDQKLIKGHLFRP